MSDAPKLPPAWVGNLMLAGRAAVRRGLNSVLPAQLPHVERVHGLIELRVLAIVTEAGWPSLLADGPRTADDLAESSGLAVDPARRIARYLVSRGVLSRRSGDRYRTTKVFDALRPDHPDSAHHWVRYLGGRVNWRTWEHADHAFRTGSDATVDAFGVPFFEYFNQLDPAAGEVFNKAMAEMSALFGAVLPGFYDGFDGATTICDVGGGDGTLLATVLSQHPHLVGVTYDLPEVVMAATDLFARGGLADRATAAGGDFFESVPAGHDVYLLKNVVHDWDDARSAQILTNVASSMSPTGRVVLVESVLVPGRRGDMATAFDLHMLVLTGAGRERTLDEFAALLAGAGLRLTRHLPIAGDIGVIEAVRA